MYVTVGYINQSIQRAKKATSKPVYQPKFNSRIAEKRKRKRRSLKRLANAINKDEIKDLEATTGRANTQEGEGMKELQE